MTENIGIKVRVYILIGGSFLKVVRKKRHEENINLKKSQFSLQFSSKQKPKRKEKRSEKMKSSRKKKVEKD